MPAPATITTLGQRERRFVLDVLDPNALRPPDEDRVRVGRVDDVVDLYPELLGLGDVLLGGVDEDCEMVQERSLRIARPALVELDEGPADLDPRLLRRAGRRVAEPEPLVHPRG